MAERLALPTSDRGAAGSNTAGGKILPEPKRRFIAQSLLFSPSIVSKMTETLTHPSIHVCLRFYDPANTIESAEGGKLSSVTDNCLS